MRNFFKFLWAVVEQLAIFVIILIAVVISLFGFVILLPAWIILLCLLVVEFAADSNSTFMTYIKILAWTSLFPTLLIWWGFLAYGVLK